MRILEDGAVAHRRIKKYGIPGLFLKGPGIFFSPPEVTQAKCLSGDPEPQTLCPRVGRRGRRPMRKVLVTAVTLTVVMLPGIVLCETKTEKNVTEVVVTATRLETPVDEVSGTILVISAEEIEERQARTVADAIAGLPGVDLVSQGGPGKTSSILLRGGDTRFTLVMVDGVEVNDPSNPERTFDFAHMTTGDIDRIEVLFGPQSTLYGSDAIGGVINIITKKGTEQPHVTVEVETGSFETYREYAAVRGGSGNVSYSLSAQHQDTEGISAASEADGNTERDGYENLTLAGSLGLEPGKGISLQLDLRSVDASNELDYSGGPGGDDPNFTGEVEQLMLGGRLTMFPAEIWELSLAVSSNVHERHDLKEPDPVRNFTMELEFKGRSEKVELVNNFYLSDSSTFTLGVDSERETGESTYFSDEFGPFSSVLPEESARIDGIFLQEQYTAPSGLAVTLGTRVDDHSGFGREKTYRVGISVPVSRRTRFRTVYGTGFRAPSIDQLFNPDYGNPDLAAERSRGWDAGLEAALGEKVAASLAWHLTRYDDLIAWFDADGDPNTWDDGSYANISTARTEGVDMSLDARSGNVSLSITGSLLRTEDDQGEELLRRPEARWGTRVGCDLTETVTLAADTVYVGERKDWGGVTLGSYTLVDLAGSWRMSRNLKLFGRIRNMLDEEYEEAGGYGTPGRAAYVGVRAEL
jgi:vitamin B12 transporter